MQKCFDYFEGGFFFFFFAISKAKINYFKISPKGCLDGCAVPACEPAYQSGPVELAYGCPLMGNRYTCLFPQAIEKFVATTRFAYHPVHIPMGEYVTKNYYSVLLVS